MSFTDWLNGLLGSDSDKSYDTLALAVREAFQYEDDRVTSLQSDVEDLGWAIDQQEANDVSMLLSVIRTMVTAMTAIVVVNIANLRQYVDRRIDDLSSQISSRIDWFMRIVNLLVFGLRLLIDGLRDWVQVAIAAPLWAALNAFIKWATGEIWHLLQYILHPELLVKLIAGYLWGVWVQLLRAFAVPMARYLMRVMFTLKDEFVGILLDVLAEII